MKKTGIFIILSFLLILHSAAMAQSALERDAALWFNAYLQKKIKKQVYLHLNQQYRFTNNISQLGLFYYDAGVTYKFNKHFKVMGDYVYANKKDPRLEFFARHQIYGALVARIKHHRWTFSYRNMVQLEIDGRKEKRVTELPEICERNKITAKYLINRYWTLYSAAELYLPVNNAKVKGFDRLRNFAGAFYSLSKKHEVEFYFLLQNQLNSTKRTKQDFIYGIGYSLAL